MFSSHKADERVEVPMNKVTILEFAGLVFDTGFVFEDKLEDGRWASLDKFDKYVCETISSLLRKDGSKPLYLSSEYICQCT